MYLSMYAQLLRFFLLEYIPQSQHAYMAGRGVITAWKEVIEKVINSRDIYEFDLKGFFDSVNPMYITEMLKSEFSLPKEDLVFIKNLLLSTPKIPENPKLDESVANKRSSIDIKDDYAKWWWGLDDNIDRIFSNKTSSGMSNRQTHV